ncbi:phage tail protein [Ancylobacter lacus]|uniref:phage tail protein n=1 Tax=Ancylobacter lacus TaxID=2579970 RepID=UPI001BCCBC12|nr:tail fiber protein [Ancylobacter lacus]MBS7538152.1 phage tail protein [Ancylobacter lacus]
MDAFIGEIRPFAFNFAPVNWAFCNGSQLPTMQNQALYSVIAGIYGPVTNSTFTLPNLQGRAALGAGSGPGLTSHNLGSVSGTETVRLDIPHLPTHQHLLNTRVSGDADMASSPSNVAWLSRVKVVGNTSVAENFVPTGASVDTTLSPLAIGNAGSSTTHENRQPYLALNYCICLDGAYPAHD